MSDGTAALPPLAVRRQAPGGRTALRALPPPTDDLPGSTRGWLEGHVEKLLAFVASAALSAALVSRLLPAPPVAVPPAAKPLVVAPAATAARSVPAPAPVRAPAPAPVPVAVPVPIAAPVPVAAPPVQIALPHPEKAAARPQIIHPVAHPAAAVRTVKVAKKAAHRAKRRAAHNRRAVAAAVRAERSVAPAASSTDRWIDQGTEALARHDEAEAMRDFQHAADAGKLPRPIRQKLGLLHVAAALRDRRAGNEAGARREFQAAHRADPDNARAAAELASPDDGVELHDAIDPD